MLINTEAVNEYLSFFMFIFFSLGLCFFMLCLSWILGGRSSSRYKNTPFESGIVSSGNTNLYFSVKFYLIAMFFVVFDVEALYLYAWSVSIKESGWIGFSEALMFGISLLLGLFYLVRIRALNWSSSVKNNIQLF
ncbi:NADH-quinone oxidoreductase subunit A [Buchnera aphidicola str. APS (Acyrthosiphon pisum)]|uniref:NADH-quinone oxidoreductase subunit A n=2 Tax=Buchnera aphidicola TaxID=9 RepID=NUOA_BUCAI|nr:NADH-quinone oxidoreductase subunit A [Buchnera aphidicola]P57252.1 RecName: Full=NADH-quinone oxidoreductase subunit A; AltName: Full=NADH dehydrogenase I subunit A; AltName: Full=NDH-1 subunit A; AltName: Full=NUO1 [Buchnera aphidicola str. APS (Acyrthosiphon pisum)]pir/H84947/ NADH2 dehydrogenase (ubiquinone) (EC 1.6.5.3) chain A [imported] - Buchnera sp. (strain APS) [Buchnera sp. (in: enterobacteria)]ADP66550.1 NADH dehydrogenase I chain A [Buchnera aphidicola str. TLW03 (Acyrthosiphon p